MAAADSTLGSSAFVSGALPRGVLSPARWSAAMPPVHTGRRKRGGTSPTSIEQRRSTGERSAKYAQNLVAVWCGHVVAKSARCEFVEGRFYFPESSVRWEHLSKAGYEVKHNPIGRAVYYDVAVPVAGAEKKRRRARAAWSYRNLKKEWSVMEGRTTFWKGVKIQAAVDNLLEQPQETPKADVNDERKHARKVVN